jgi:hypothetical protein
MAQKRMFSKIITNSEEFLDMPVSSQMLYFHLNMNADDDGFVQPKIIMRMIGGVKEDDLKILYAKGFVIPIADKVIIIKHWHINNTIRKDRYSPTIYKEHLKNLGIDENNAYNYDGKPLVNQMATQYSIVKDSIVKSSKEQTKKYTYFNFDQVKLEEKEYQSLINKYGSNNVKRIIEKLHNYKLANGKRYKSDYGAINHWVVDALKIIEIMPKKNDDKLTLKQAEDFLLEGYKK